MKLKQSKNNIESLFSLQGKLSEKEFWIIKNRFNWKINYKLIHIVGTNGKGSNAKYINDELIENNYNVGLFTSPHIYKHNERIKVNNIEIDDNFIFSFYEKLKNSFPNLEFGWFDFFFLCSLDYFESKEIDVAIIESGIGAKKDITNYINYHYLLITSISLDHENILGKTIEEIAIDKSYAIKNKVEVFAPKIISDYILNIFESRAIETNSKLHIVNVNKKTFVDINVSLSKKFLKEAFNINEFRSDFNLPIGRIQKIIINGIECFVDVAHNIESISCTLDFFRKNQIHFEQVFLSISKDKNKQIFDIIKNEFNVIYSYQNSSKKSLDINEYDNDFERVKNLKMFLNHLDKKTLFIGSFYLVSEILKEVYHNKKSI